MNVEWDGCESRYKHLCFWFRLNTWELSIMVIVSPYICQNLMCWDFFHWKLHWPSTRLCFHQLCNYDVVIIHLGISIPDINTSTMNTKQCNKLSIIIHQQAQLIFNFSRINKNLIKIMMCFMLIFLSCNVAHVCIGFAIHLKCYS